MVSFRVGQNPHNKADSSSSCFIWTNISACLLTIRRASGKYLQERLIQKTGITNYHLLNGDKDPAEVMRRVGAALQSAPIDIAFTGLGENGHLAFNDPPADFETKEPFILVNLDMTSRKQQLEEGWFPTLEEVPQRAISMSIWQILQSKAILCIAPEARKAQAVKECFEGKVSPLHPASSLRTHPNVTVYLDESSAALLSQRPYCLLNKYALSKCAPSRPEWAAHPAFWLVLIKNN